MKNLRSRINIMDRQGANRMIKECPPATPRQTVVQDAEYNIALAMGESVEADPMNILILNYTMTCPLACDYCCYSCGPKRTETMDLDFALNLIEQAAELRVFSECGFTGGEPLVYFDDIITLTTRMSQLGLPFSMISACDWATDSPSTNRFIDPLVDRGMSVFTVSHDPSHERFVPRANIRRVMDRVLKRGVRAVLCGSFYDDKTDLKDMFPEYANEEMVSFVTRVVLPTTGRADRLKIQPSFYPNADLDSGGTCYKRFYHDVTVFWDGEVYPCCSVYNRATPGISYGNAYDTPLAKIWDRIAGSMFLYLIKREGLRSLLRFVRERAPELIDKLPDDSQPTVGPCHLCHLVMRESEISERIHELFAQEERKRVAKILRNVSHQHGEEVAVQLMQTALAD